MDANLLIEASAGTGKTQALAKRLIELARGGLEPHEIVALTFSRAAAGEIFERFISLLSEEAADRTESAALLRRVIATQHLSQIGTLDSFLTRVVRMFPLELGLDGQAEIMDDFGIGREVSRTLFAILRRTDTLTRRAFTDAFALAMDGEDVRSYVESFRGFVEKWHSLVLAHPEASAWGEPTAIWGETPEWASTDEQGLARLADALEGLDGDGSWPEFVGWVRTFRGSLEGVKGFAKKFLEMGPELFEHATIDVKFNRKEHVFGGEGAHAIRRAILGVCGYVVRRGLALARGVHALIAEYEVEYAKKVRGRGRLCFADVPRLLAAMPDPVRLALEYRLDARIRAWALDEFQDTSREQWRALGPLVNEATQSDGEKSVFVVGDCKQAIYGWREGDVGIFRRERDSGQYAIGKLNMTYRSSKAVVDAVNAVFVNGSLRNAFPGWEASEHISARPEMPGFVQAVVAPGRALEDYFEPVRAALAAADPVRRGISAAVLVRGNKMGEKIATYLKLKGMDGVVWEGESAILDTPALQGFVDLATLSDHPGDKQAYRHFASTPLAAAMYPDGVPDASEVSMSAARSFMAKGLVRTFRELRALLPEEPSEAWSEFTETRFTDMLRAASEFELSMEPGTRLSDFADFLAAKKKRNIAEPGKVKIMTIHRSKGLGFDYVVLPLYESDPIDAKSDGPLVADGWVVPDPGATVASMLPGLSGALAARQERVEEEALCTYYVAMTRAKNAMTVICRPPSKTSARSYVSDFVRDAIPEPIGDPLWYDKLGDRTDGQPASAHPLPVFRRGQRASVRRRLPSLSFHSGMSAGELFADSGSREAAKRRGTDVHAQFEAIEWIDPAAPKDEFERKILANGWTDAFVKGTDAVALWRERGYELLVGSEWQSGQLDRVVFRGEGDGRSATVYDFKTNAMHRGETEDGFAARMRDAYAGQMSAYRAAVSRLAGIAPGCVRTVLLLVSTGAAVAVP